jgi:prepilin-type N-terminal cleavage/methylation domain-containing protein
MRCQQDPARRGWTLVESLVVIAILSVLLASVTVIIQKIVRQEGGFGKHLAHQRVMERLADQFRQDVHAAVRVEGPPAAADNAVARPGAVRCFRADGPPVTYRLHGHRLMRTATNSDGRETRRSFAFPHGATVQLDRDGRVEPRLAALEVEYPEGFALPTARAGREIRRKWIIEAVVGRDRRWQAVEEDR